MHELIEPTNEGHCANLQAVASNATGAPRSRHAHQNTHSLAIDTNLERLTPSLELSAHPVTGFGSRASFSVPGAGVQRIWSRERFSWILKPLQFCLILAQLEIKLLFGSQENSKST